MPRVFRCVNSKGLEQRGVRGDFVTVRTSGSGLIVEGAEGGSVRIEPRDVDRIRLFRMETVHSLHAPLPAMFETKIWWGGKPTPALLMPGDDFESYRAAIMMLARSVAAMHGLERLRLGPGYLTGIINLLIVGVPTLMLLAGALAIAYLDGGWWWLAAAVIFMIFFWLAGRNIVSRWPRRVRSFEAFEAELDWK